MSRFTTFLSFNEGKEFWLTSDNVTGFRNKIEKSVNAPYVKVSMSNLGGTPAISVAISLDEPANWPKKILMNSRYSKFILYPEIRNSNMEQIAVHYELKPKFRATKIKNVEEAIIKINNWIKSVK